MKTDCNNRSRLLLLCTAFLLASVTALADGFMTPEYAHGKYRPKSMVLLPPQASVTKNKVASTEQMIEEGSKLEDAAAIELQKALHTIGYELRVLRVAQVNADPELQAMIRTLNERYDEETSRFRVNFMGGLKGEDVRERRFKLGDTARIVAAKLGADALAIGRIAAQGATGGQKTMAALFGGSMGFAALHIGIIAGDNGDLEAYYIGVDGNMSPEKLAEQPVEVMVNVVSRTLKNFPEADEPGEYKKRWPQSSNREVPVAAKSDEAIMSELEAALSGGTTPAETRSSEASVEESSAESPESEK